MRFKTCKLYEKVRNVDDFGYESETYSYVTDIEIEIAVNKFKAVENGIVYHAFETVGITPYNGFELNKVYKIMDGEIEYISDKFVPSRFTTLTLTRLV